MDASALLEVLRKSVRSCTGGEERVAVAYSGGLDSSVIAALASEKTTVRAYTCATPRSFDRLNAWQRARAEGLEHLVVELSSAEVVNAVELAGSVVGTSNPIEIAYTIPIIVVLRESAEKTVLAGNGADELFGGYARYLSTKDPREMMKNDLRKARAEAALIESWAASMGRRARFPFMDERVVRFSESLSADQKISAMDRKVILREVARSLGLPSYRLPKKAAQYSSGILREMERIARSNDLTLAEWTRSISPADGRSA